MATLRPLATRLGRDHALSQPLWASGWHEARVLAALVEEPAKLTRRLMDERAAAFNSWDLCDHWCIHAFRRTPHASARVQTWAAHRAEFAKRVAFSLLAVLAIHDQGAPTSAFQDALSLVESAATDERHYVKKSVNWALRQIGKRNARLRRHAIASARRIQRLDAHSARWIASDALRELQAVR